MAKQTKLFKFLNGVIFLIVCALPAAACVFARPIVLNRFQTFETKAFRENIKSVLPAFDNEPWNESFLVGGTRVYPARREEKVSLPGDLSGVPEQEPQTVTVNVLKGFAFEVPARDGEGPNSVWIGFDGDGGLVGYRPSFFRSARVPENFTDKIELQTTASLSVSEAVKTGKEIFESQRNLFVSGAHESQEVL